MIDITPLFGRHLEVLVFLELLELPVGDEVQVADILAVLEVPQIDFIPHDERQGVFIA